MAPQDESWNLGFLADAHGKIYKRAKLGNDTYFKMNYQWVALDVRSGPIEDALNRAKIFPDRLAGVFQSRSSDPRQTTSLPPFSALAPEPHSSTASGNARGRKRTRDDPESKRSKSPKRAKQSHELPDPLPGRSPSPSGDLRIPLWQNETRAFKGISEHFPRAKAQKLAMSAQEGKLWAGGKPQFNLFVAGSYSPYAERVENMEHKLPEHRSWGRGGYAVAFRDPYSIEENVQSVDNNKHKSQDGGKKKVVGKKRRHDFNIHAWNSCRVLSSYHTELAGIAQALHTVLTSVRQNRPPSGAYVCIFTISEVCVKRLQNKRAMAYDEPVTVVDALTTPLMRAIVWLSHRLAEEKCEVKVQWLPSRCVGGIKLASNAATSSWKMPVFHQRNRPASQRDGIMDAVHGDLMEIVGRINAGTQPLVPPQCGSKKKEGGDDGDMLDKFSGSTVQKEIEKQCEITDMSSGAGQESESNMVDEGSMDESRVS